MLNRRDFLKQSLAVVSLGVAVPGVFGRAVVASAAERGSATVANGKTLVVVQLAGGVDGLNVAIPYKDPAYRDNRPTLGVKDEDMLPLNDRIALHSSLTEMKDLFTAGHLAVVEGVGYPNPNYSHFRSMDIWQSADPDGVAKDGWLGRYFEDLTDLDGHPLAGLSVGRSLPSSMEAPKVAVPAIESSDTFSLKVPAGDEGQKRTTSLMRMYDAYRPAKAQFAALLDTTLDSAQQSSKDLATAHTAYQPSVTYPQSSLASGLRLLAELIDSGKDGASPLRVGHVTLGGFDTHTQETTRITGLLKETSQSISAFLQDMDAHGHGDDVIVMTWSEFGRRVHENAQNGTDHGSSAPMFVAGKSVKGGFYGEPSPLNNLDSGNLRFTTDFRSVYATVLEKWLQAPSKDVLGKQFDTLGFL